MGAVPGSAPGPGHLQRGHTCSAPLPVQGAPSAPDLLCPTLSPPLPYTAKPGTTHTQWGWGQGQAAPIRGGGQGQAVEVKQVLAPGACFLAGSSLGTAPEGLGLAHHTQGLPCTCVEAGWSAGGREQSAGCFFGACLRATRRMVLKWPRSGGPLSGLGIRASGPASAAPPHVW